MEISNNYTIEICPEKLLYNLQLFINDHWKKNHPLAVSSALMNWQHYNKHKKEFNFIIARNSVTNEFYGILGFIPTMQFDDSITENDIWLAIWKVKDGVNLPGMGIALLDFLSEKIQPRSVSAFGLSKMVVPIYKHLKFKTGLLNHYYIVNKEENDFRLIGNFNNVFHSNNPLSSQDIIVKNTNTSEFLALSKEKGDLLSFNKTPQKSLRYILNRYFNHPVYQYDIYYISNNNLSGILVLRAIQCENKSALRIIDFLGDVEILNKSYNIFSALLKKYNAEYIDFYCYGFNHDILSNAGFIRREKDSEVIVPNYYEPFQKKNIDLDFACKSPAANDYIICKGDSDQDRPNIIHPPGAYKGVEK